MAGPETGVEDGVRAALDEIQALKLGKGAAATTGGVTAEGFGIGWGIGSIFAGAINSEGAQAKQPSAGHVGRGEGLADALEERDQGKVLTLGLRQRHG